MRSEQKNFGGLGINSGKLLPLGSRFGLQHLYPNDFVNHMHLNDRLYSCSIMPYNMF